MLGTPQMPDGATALGRSMYQTWEPSGDQYGCTQQPPAVRRRSTGAGVLVTVAVGAGVGEALAVGLGVAVGTTVAGTCDVITCGNVA